MRQDSQNRKRGRLFGSERGSSAVEVALVLPWIVGSFLAVLDFGFASYALIATQNAARVVATWGSASSTNSQTLIASPSAACGTYAAPQFKYAPTSLNACGSALSATPSPGSIGATGTGAGVVVPTVQVDVGYTVNIIAIPGLMPNSITITRRVTMPVR